MNVGGDRRYSINDGMILIAGLAAGMGFVRLTTPGISAGQFWAVFLNELRTPSPGGAFEFLVETVAMFVVPFVAGWTPACLLLQWARPRPPWRRLRRQPGFVACLIASAIVAATIVVSVSMLATSIWDVKASGDDYDLKAHLLGGLLTGSGVLCSWVTMRLCGVCRPCPTGTDRLGRLTGSVWLGISVVCACYLALLLN
ncbi:hypothetical protein ACYOEI_14105 [Singulisphaera rosea]